jgi:hypothetical protein
MCTFIEIGTRRVSDEETEAKKLARDVEQLPRFLLKRSPLLELFIDVPPPAAACG